MQISLGNIAVVVALLGVLVRFHLFANRIERRLGEHDEMWLDYCIQHGYPVSDILLAKFQTVNRDYRKARPRDPNN